jgi:hypothetical protein
MQRAHLADCSCCMQRAPTLSSSLYCDGCFSACKQAHLCSQFASRVQASCLLLVVRSLQLLLRARVLHRGDRHVWQCQIVLCIVPGGVVVLLGSDFVGVHMSGLHVAQHPRSPSARQQSLSAAPAAPAHAPASHCSVVVLSVFWSGTFGFRVRRLTWRHNHVLKVVYRQLLLVCSVRGSDGACMAEQAQLYGSLYGIL